MQMVKKALHLLIQFKMGSIEVNQTMDAPVLGEHTSDILKDLGYSEEEIKALMEKSVITQRTRKQA